MRRAAAAIADHDGDVSCSRWGRVGGGDRGGARRVGAFGRGDRGVGDAWDEEGGRGGCGDAG